MTPPIAPIVKNPGLERTDPLGAGGHAGYSPLEGSEGAPSQKMDSYSVSASESFLDKILTGVGRGILSIFSAPWGCARVEGSDLEETRPFPQADAGPQCPDPQGYDNTRCHLLSAQDNPEDINSFRYKIEHGFNRENDRMCTDAIEFETEGEVVELKSTLRFTNAADGDGDNCTSHDDPYNLIVAGNGTVIDATQIDPDQCVFELKNSGAHFQDMVIRTKNPEKVFCDEGKGNTYSTEDGVVIEKVDSE